MTYFPSRLVPLLKGGNARYVFKDLEHYISITVQILLEFTVMIERETFKVLSRLF